MCDTTRGLLVLAGVLLCAVPAAGQPAADGSLPAAERQVRLIEQGLEQAVRRGVDALEQRLPAPLPGLVVFAGTIRARGFVVDGYGLFFDVEFPVVRRSILWSITAMRQHDSAMAQSLANLRRRVLEMPPGLARSTLEEMVHPRAGAREAHSGVRAGIRGRGG